MLTAVLYIIRQTSYALSVFLNIDVKLTDQKYIKMYWLIVLPFILYTFIKVMYVATNQSVQVSAPSRETKAFRQAVGKSIRRK